MTKSADLVSMEMPFSTPSASGLDLVLSPSSSSRVPPPLPPISSGHVTGAEASTMDVSLNLMQTSTSNIEVITTENRHDYIRKGSYVARHFSWFRNVLSIEMITMKHSQKKCKQLVHCLSVR